MSDEERYAAAFHAMQAGVKTETNLPGEENKRSISGVDLRVGVNSALCDNAALVNLLIAKGVITDAEYWKAIADEMEAEKARYEARISSLMGGAKITLV